ncbi:helix-turn-helix domain-containing protein [Streptomyces sp. JNUCC 64]
MSSSTDIGTGARIEQLRKASHLTQRGLADKAGVSYSLYTKVASGKRLATPVFVAACARALSVDPQDLYGQPYRDKLREDRIDRLLEPVTTALDWYDLDPDEDIRPRRYEDLASDVRALGKLHDEGGFSTMAKRIAPLAEEIRAAALFRTDQRLWGLLSQVYRGAYDVGIRFGFHNLARIALDRVDWAAQRAHDLEAAPLRGMRQYQRSLIHMKAGDYATGLRMTEAGMKALDGADEAAWTAPVRGQLLLGSALLHARAGAVDTALALLKDAGRIAARTGEQPDVFWMGWGPTNVAVHEVGVLTDAGQAGKAVKRARTVAPPPSWPASRRARLSVTVARSEMWVGNGAGALEALQRARKQSPEVARYNPQVHEVVAGLVRASRQSAPESLLGYAHWAGVKY